jgi:5-(carboxyamino)imidazole ribonucleotide mutase
MYLGPNTKTILPPATIYLSDTMSVCVIMGSASDKAVAEKATGLLTDMGVPFEVHVCSAHRTPDRLRELVSSSEARVFVAIAGLSAALPGAVAAHTLRPVIGVPVSGNVNMDSILSVVQMPPGIPVGAVGLDRGENAALLAIQILALGDPELEKALQKHREAMAEKVSRDDKAVGGESGGGS